ncbi:hypothetical protein [Cognatiyoonia sp. IB215182]|uniref:hypothetical protein n=1 Tax=Cognatiyoonia sp. IB215182 TaxID=3097353 RepID=UPI002A117BEE|nr:hypothetical protein [Cognatiyoonia sp. IB215182]MDX8353496.1 hypothetical protein [Cognatiyoonia sp. IB215182]
MTDFSRKAPLYRKVNTRTHRVRHGGGKAKWQRNTKAGKLNPSAQRSMHSDRRNGRDYTPLFKFLLSKVGKCWEDVYKEATARLDQTAPIFWLVASAEQDKKPFVRVGESTYYSGLYIDQENRLALVDPDLTVDDMTPFCGCCTHTFNGEVFTQSYQP